MPIKKPCAFINARSGSTTDITKPLTSKLESVFDTLGPIAHVEPDEICQGIEAALNDGCDLIIIYGGDGSALSAAKLATARGVPIVPLPGGTMNLLPKTLYDTTDWEIALNRALECQSARWMAAGYANDAMFLCGCIIGTPTRLNDVREQIRSKHFKQAAETLVFNLVDFESGDVFKYGIGTNPDSYYEANLLNIICPQMSDTNTGRGGMEIVALDVDGFFDVAKLGLSAVASDWRESDSAKGNISDAVHVKGTGQIDILLDGEPARLDLPLHIRLAQKGVLILAPDK